MVGIFSRFSGGWSGHRRTQSAAEIGVTLAPPSAEVGGSNPVVTDAAAHGIDVAVEFKPVEHPVEPLNRDQPVKCPLPEPSILNDGRIWKERMSSVGARVRTDLPVVKEGSDASGTKSRPPLPRRVILPSISAPEHNIVTLLEECNAAENRSAGE
ncbi:uncharacterized protein [Typha angustifolia]|uniref:uncharacterized protein n=1 Tax=Typha angustifolia TaxID=59011 RepID=UPI003C2EF68B